MQVTDVIHRNVIQTRGEMDDTTTTVASSKQSISAQPHSFRSPVPPGVVEGATAFVLTSFLLLPVRRLAIRLAGKQLNVLTDLVVTAGQAVLAANAGLYAGSLYGSRVYLEKLAQIPPTAPSAASFPI